MQNIKYSIIASFDHVSINIVDSKMYALYMKEILKLLLMLLKIMIGEM